MDVLQLSPEVEVAHIGPPLEKGRLASAFYFALSSKESLDLDPYNQPAIYLAKKDCRVFSIDLPFHGPNLNAIDAMNGWANAFERGEDPLTPFIDHTIFALNELIDRGLIIREKIGLMGLSRGGLLACLLATKFPDIRAIVGFAPMTQLTLVKEFTHLQNHPQVNAFNLENHLDVLCEQTIRFYIGNRDLRVGTEHCFQLVRQLSELAYQNGERSPTIELTISPSIGHQGHGTSKAIFETGAQWLGTKLGVVK